MSDESFWRSAFLAASRNLYPPIYQDLKRGELAKPVTQWAPDYVSDFETIREALRRAKREGLR